VSCNTLDYWVYYYVTKKINCRDYLSIFVERLVSYSGNKQKGLSLRGQAGWAKMTAPGGKLTALACHRTKKANKAE
jgi:hypothetical protein